MSLPMPRLTLSLSAAAAKVYLLRHLPTMHVCCAMPQRRLVFLAPAHLPLADHAWPAVDCTNCQTLTATPGWRGRVWERLVLPFVPFTGWVHLAEPAVWLDPPLREVAHGQGR